MKLKEVACMLANADTKRLFNGETRVECSTNNMFWNHKPGCPAVYRNLMIKHVRSQLQLVDEDYVASVLFLLHVCRLGGTYVEEYDHNNQCSTTSCTPHKGKAQFKLNPVGASICHQARRTLIGQCMKSNIITTTGTSISEKCTILFKQLLYMSTPNRGTIPTETQLSEAESKVLVLDVERRFALDEKSTWIIDGAAPTTNVQDACTMHCNVNTIMFNPSSTTAMIKSNVKRLFGGVGQLGAYLNARQLPEFFKEVGYMTSPRSTTLPAGPNSLGPVHKKVHAFLLGFCKETEGCMVKYLETELAKAAFPSALAKEIEIKMAFKEFGKTLGMNLISLLPCISQPKFFKLTKLSLFGDLLFKVVGRRHLLWSWSETRKVINLKIGDRDKDLSMSVYQPPKTSQPWYGAQIALGRSISWLLTQPVSSQEYWEEHHLKPLLLGRLILEVDLVPATEDAFCGTIPHPTNHEFNLKEYNTFICKCVLVLKDIGPELCPVEPRQGRPVRRGKMQNFPWVVTETRGKTKSTIVFVDVPTSMYLYIIKTQRIVNYNDVLHTVCQNTRTEASTDDKYLGDLILDLEYDDDDGIAYNHIKLCIDYKMYCDFDGADVWRKADDDKSHGSFVKLDCMSSGWSKKSGLARNTDLVTFVGIWPGKDSNAMLTGALASYSGMKKLREDEITIVVDFKNRYVGWHIVYTLDSMAQEALGGGQSCRGSPPRDVGCRPWVKRIDTRRTMDVINLGGDQPSRVKKWNEKYCSINFFHQAFIHLKFICKPIFKLTIGFENFRVFWPDCRVALFDGDRSLPNWTANTIQKCNKVFKIFQPTKYFNRMTNRQHGSWSRPSLNHKLIFWCPKNVRACTEFVKAGMNMFYAQPKASTQPAPQLATATATTNNQIHGGQPVVDVGMNLNENDLIATNQPEGDVDDDDDTLQDVDAERVAVEATDLIVVNTNANGWIKVLPDRATVLLFDIAYQMYLDIHPWLKLDEHKAQVEMKDLCLRSKETLDTTVEKLEAEIDGASDVTREDRKILKKKKTTLVNLQKNGQLPGIASLKAFMDKNTLDKDPHSTCVTQSGDGFDDIRDLMTIIDELDLNAVDKKKLSKDIFDVFHQREGNALTKMKKMIKDKAPMGYTKTTSPLGELQFRQDVRGECSLVDSLHCGLRCIGTSATTALLSDVIIHDKFCIREGESRMSCMKKQVKLFCGTYVALEMNGDKIIIKKNGGHHFTGCLFKMDWTACFSSSLNEIKEQKKPELCRSEAQTMEAWGGVQKVARYIHWFAFMSNDREAEFGYTAAYLQKYNDEEKDPMDDDLTMFDLMRLHFNQALNYYFDLLGKVRPTTELTIERVQPDGSTASTIRSYNPFNTRSCRYLGPYLIELYDQCIDTSVVNTDVSERCQGIVRLVGRHYVMKGRLAAEQVLKFYDLYTRVVTQIPGIAKVYVRDSKKRELKRQEKYQPSVLLEDMLTQSKIPIFTLFDASYKPAVAYAENQEIMIELHENIVDGLDHGAQDTGLAPDTMEEEEEEMENAE